MMAGGSTVVSMVLVICLIGLLIASPFGIFFSGEDSGTGYTMPEAVRTLNGEFTDRIEKIKAEHPKYKVLLTFFSPSGYEVRKNYKGADVICYLAGCAGHLCCTDDYG